MDHGWVEAWVLKVCDNCGIALGHWRSLLPCRGTPRTAAHNAPEAKWSGKSAKMIIVDDPMMEEIEGHDD